jgi:hypothetical protein
LCAPKSLVSVGMAPGHGIGLRQIADQSGIVFVPACGSFQFSNGLCNLAHLQQGEAKQAAPAGVPRCKGDSGTAALKGASPIPPLKCSRSGMQCLME